MVQKFYYGIKRNNNISTEGLKGENMERRYKAAEGIQGKDDVQVSMSAETSNPMMGFDTMSAMIVVAKASAQALPDVQALSVKILYPTWQEIIGQTVKQGYKFLHGDVLYKTIQDHTLIQEQYIPGEGTESLYAVLDETHAGTKEDPIPYSGNMELENGKYYSQDGVTYLCNRDTEIPAHQPLYDLIGIYVQAAE